MPDDLLARALEQPERSEPTVRVAALFRIARVESAADIQHARNTFERALAEARGITGVDAAALAGLPELLGVQSEYRPPSDRPRRRVTRGVS